MYIQTASCSIIVITYIFSVSQGLKNAFRFGSFLKREDLCGSAGYVEAHVVLPAGVPLGEGVVHHGAVDTVVAAVLAAVSVQDHAVRAGVIHSDLERNFKMTHKTFRDVFISKTNLVI